MLTRLIWFSGAFTVLVALLLGATVANHAGILDIPEAYQPYCGPQGCRYGELVTTLLLMTFVGAVVHLGTRLVRHVFATY
jgi:hypothetical protein